MRSTPTAPKRAGESPIKSAPVRCRLRGKPLLATMTAVERLPHGYTNRTRRVGDRIEKRYEGADAVIRAEREFTSLTGLHGRYPVPEVLQFDSSVPMLLLTDVVGSHGQELIDHGRGAMVLGATGSPSWLSFRRLTPPSFLVSKVRAR